ncbi:DDE-type integrase/transposase/recombinase [Paucidesulfovibrio longus]|uniref:DDE-type integrase/transposase/recombinase n=1 Tax=Paucidesulfovibrio longus TaxID=889 RepID=UPI0003B3EA17|nr:DDE-type integrase/transposase/recombinase [Paucidesulfovibrio longus]
MFRVNETLACNGSIYRILHLTPEYATWISLDDPSAFPVQVSLMELRAGLEDGTVKREEDPFAKLALLTPEEGSTARIKRDKNHALILPIINDPRCYEPKMRGAAMRRIVDSGEATKRHLFTLIRRYWQRGQTPNALLPDYRNSGGRGKSRKAENKLGRPRMHSPGIGAIIDAQTERLFRIALDRHYLKETTAGFPYAYRRFLDLYENMFPDTPKSEMPTKGQMYHFYRREYGQADRVKKRMNPLEYNKDGRPLTGTAGADVAGPGSRFEIDATIADIYLVSDSDRRNIVGRPVVYLVVDVFSRMIAGLYIGFRAPSYAMAIQALAVAMTDKVAWCQKHGLEITHEQWPVSGIPDAILADRGELLGSQIEALENSFSVRIENTPPYRGDAKGIVERYFNTIQAGFKPYAPGVVNGTLVKKHGGRDYRLDAVLTLRDFREIIIASVLMHNQSHPLDKYDRTADMPADLPMTPLAIWNWGIQHRTGRLRSAPEDALRISLLPRTSARISELGVSVFGLYYSSPEIVQQGWLHRAKGICRPTGLYAAYDPANADCIYLFPEKGGSTVWKCQLTTRCREFSGCSFWDVWETRAVQKKTQATTHMTAEGEQRRLDRFVEEKIQSAQRQADTTEKLSNSARIRAIRNNKSQAIKEEQRIPFYLPETSPKGNPAKIVHIHNVPGEDCEFPSFIDELYDEDE